MDTLTAEAPADTTQTTEAAAPTDAVDAVPSQEGTADVFASALDAAFEAMDAPTSKPDDAAEPEPATDAKAAEPEPEPVTDSTEATEDSAEIDPIEDLDESVKDWTPKAGARFKELKAQLKTQKGELEGLRQQELENQNKIKELTGLAEGKDVEGMQTKLAEFEKQQALTDLEATSAYKEAVSGPLNALMEEANVIADKYEIDSETLVDAMALDDTEAQDAQIGELLADASERDRAKIYRIIEDIDPIINRRNDLYENADAALAEAKLVAEQESAAAAAEKLSLRKNVTRNVVERIGEKLPFLKGIDGLDMSAVEAKAAETDPTVANPVDIAYNAVSAQLFPTVIRQYLQGQKEVEALASKLAEYEEADPGVSGQPQGDQTSAAMAAQGSLADRLNAQLSGIT